MACVINLFLKTELTIVPVILNKYFGNYFNNTLCNGATWMFLLWYILHTVFDNVLNALLKKMKHKQYIRNRLLQSLWYLGFYSTALTYCIAALISNNTPLFSVENPFDNTNSSQLILGFIVILTFYLHSAFWEFLKHNHGILASTYLCLFFLLYFSYFFRFIEGVFRLTILICLTQIVFELTRFVAVSVTTLGRKIIVGFCFTIAVIIYILNYLIFVPVLFVLPLVKGSAFILVTFFFLWLVNELYSSALFKAVLHWRKHVNKCDENIIECSLFLPRNDATYNFLRFQKESKQREEKSMSLRKPKNNKNMVYQTLKCMVAIKRKLNEKRQNKTSNAENESTKIFDEEEKTNQREENAGNSHDESVNNEEFVGGKLEFDLNSHKENVSSKHKIE